jgi:uncharacterized membrane protein
MSTLSMWRSTTSDGAELAARAVARQQLQGRVEVLDVAVASWRIGAPRPDAHQVGDVDGRSALSGAFWGLLFGLTLLLPLTGQPGSSTDLAGIGLSDDLLDAIRDGVTEGCSALFLLAPDGAPLRALLGPETLTHELTAAQESTLLHAFGTEDAR